MHNTPSGPCTPFPPLPAAEARASLCAAVRAGHSVAGASRAPGMPSATTLFRWARKDEVFARDLAQARAEGRAAARAADWRAHQARRAEIEALAAARGRKAQRSTYTPERGRAVLERLACGATPNAIGAEPGMPAAATIYNWLRAEPEFQKAYAETRRTLAEAKLHLAWDIARTATPETLGPAKLQCEVLRWQVANLAPVKYDAAEERPAVTVVIRRFGDAAED